MNNRLGSVLLVIGVLVLLVVAYYFGSYSQKSNEVVLPTISDASAVIPVAQSAQQATVSGGTYDYTEAGSHIGENATIRGTVVDVYTSKTGTTFFDFCKSYKTCPFSAVIFASKASSFPNIKQYIGQIVTITGPITSYQGKAEIVVDSPNQIGK